MNPSSSFDGQTVVHRRALSLQIAPAVAELSAEVLQVEKLYLTISRSLSSIFVTYSRNLDCLTNLNFDLVPMNLKVN